MTKKKLGSDNIFDMLDESSEQVKESKQKQREILKHQEPEIKPFKKPGSDYYRLDMVVRDTKQSKVSYELNGKRIETTKPISTEDIVKDYKSYVSTMAAAEGISITKYIHRLIDNDMELNSKKYKQLTRSKKN